MCSVDRVRKDRPLVVSDVKMVLDIALVSVRLQVLSY